MGARCDPPRSPPSFSGLDYAPERRRRSDRPSRSLLGEAQLVERLQIQPESGARAEEMAESQRSVAGNRTLAIEDTGDAIGRHLQLRASSVALMSSALSSSASWSPE